MILKVLESLDNYQVAHLISNSQAEDQRVTACVIHHLFQSNRLRGPVLLLCSVDSLDSWLDFLHTYTQLKIAVLSSSPWLNESQIDSAVDRRVQWNNYFGELKSLYYGEFNIIVMTLTAFRSKSMLDMSYLREIGISLIVGDDLFKYIFFSPAM